MDTSQQLPTHGDGLLDMRELARALPESMVNEVMDAQADMLCEDGANARNGYRERGLATPVGDITLRIPKLRAGTYFPEGIIERYSRTDRALATAVAESWANGVSTRKMVRIARKMGIEGLSKDQVSAMCRSLDAEVGELASRDLGGIEVPYLFLDAAYVKCGRDGRVRSTAVVTAIGVGSGGARLVVGDAYAGLVRAISECLPGAGRQRCIVHLEHDVCSLLSSGRHRAIAAGALLAIFRESDPATVRSAYRAAIGAAGALSAAAGALLEDAETDALAYLDFPAEYRRRIRANNVQERMNGEMKRGSRVVQVFPSPESMLRLVGAVCAERDEDWSSRRCISPESMLRLAEPAGPEPVESEASRRRGLMIVETAMGLAGTGRRAA